MAYSLNSTAQEHLTSLGMCPEIQAGLVLEEQVGSGDGDGPGRPWLVLQHHAEVRKPPEPFPAGA